jgi:hypothetical protein
MSLDSYTNPIDLADVQINKKYKYIQLTTHDCMPSQGTLVQIIDKPSNWRQVGIKAQIYNGYDQKSNAVYTLRSENQSVCPIVDPNKPITPVYKFKL